MILDRLQIVRDIRLPLERKNVYARLGYKKGKTELSPKMIHLFDEAFEKAGRVMTPAGAYIMRQIENREETLKLSNSDVTVTATSVKELLKNSFAVLFMAVTIGPGLENQIALSSEEKQFEKTLILDAIGSEGAEAAADALNDHLLVLARQSKMTLTRRFSPGYGDLPLQFQAQLYKELSLASLGISIDDKFFLRPKKTVTALLGVER
jgi:cobalamin-dependent methionine synthase I